MTRLALLAILVASANPAVAAVTYNFSATWNAQDDLGLGGITGSVTVDDTHPGFAPGGTVSFSSTPPNIGPNGITDFTFTSGPFTWTPADQTIAIELTFGATTNDVVAHRFDITDMVGGPMVLLFTPNQPGQVPTNVIRYWIDSTLLGKGDGISSTGAYTLASTNVAPEPSSIVLAFLALGVAGVFVWRRRDEKTAVTVA